MIHRERKRFSKPAEEGRKLQFYSTSANFYSDQFVSTLNFSILTSRLLLGQFNIQYIMAQIGRERWDDDIVVEEDGLRHGSLTPKGPYNKSRVFIIAAACRTR
jgi:hypothetical protein